MKKFTKLLSLVLTFCILASCMTFTVLADTSYLDLSANKTFFKAGETADIVAFYSNLNAENAYEATTVTTLTAESSNPNAFTVTGGMVTAVKSGRATITVTDTAANITNSYIVVCATNEEDGDAQIVKPSYHQYGNATTGTVDKTATDPSGYGLTVVNITAKNGGWNLNNFQKAPLTLKSFFGLDRVLSLWFYDDGDTSAERNFFIRYAKCSAVNATQDVTIKLTTDGNYSYSPTGNFTKDTDFVAPSLTRSKGWHQFNMVVDCKENEKTHYTMYVDNTAIGKYSYHNDSDFSSLLRGDSNTTLPLYTTEPHIALYDETNIYANVPQSTTEVTSIDASSLKTTFTKNEKVNLGTVYGTYTTTRPSYTDMDGNEVPEDITTETKEITEGLTFTSDNSAVITVDNSGNVVAVGEGTANITVAYGELTDVISVTVYGSTTLGIDFTEVTTAFPVGVETEITGIYEYVTLSDGENVTSAKNDISKDVTYTVSDESVLTIESGKVTAKKTGITKIKAEYGDKSAEYFVTAYDASGKTLTYSGSKISNSTTANDPVLADLKTVYTKGNFPQSQFKYDVTSSLDITFNTWFYDDGTSALSNINFFTSGRNLILSAVANSEYYNIKGFWSEHNTNTIEVNAKRATGWHQVFITVTPGSWADNVNAKEITIYIDGQKAYSYNDTGLPHNQYTNWLQISGGYVMPLTATSYTQKGEIIETMPANGATDVPLYTAFSATFEAPLSAYDNLFTITDENGNNVSYKAVLSTNGRKVTLNAGKLSANTTYTVALNSDTSVKYTFKTRAEEENYLESELDARSLKYDLVYQRYADLKDSSKLPVEYGMLVGNEISNYAVEDGVTTEIKNGILSVKFDANVDKSNTTVGFMNIGGGAPLSDTYALDAAKDPDVIVVKYKYRVNVEAGETEISDEASIRDDFYLFGDVYSYSSQTALTNRTNKQPYAQRGNYDNGSPSYYTWKITTLEGLKQDKIGDATVTADKNWVDVTYVIERNSHEAGAENAVTYTLKVEDYEEKTATKTVADYGIRGIYHTMDSVASVATSIDFADYQVYGFDKKDTYGELIAYEKDAEGNKTAVVTNNMAGKTVYASLTALSASDKTASVIFALFDKSTNKLVSCSIKPASLVANVSQEIESDAFAVPNDEGKAYEIKAFVWTTDENGSNTMTPVFYAPSYVNEETAE